MNSTKLVTGVDEVGRGAIAGPITAVSYSLSIDTLQKLKYLLTDNLKRQPNQSTSRLVNRLKRTLKLINHDLNKALTKNNPHNYSKNQGDSLLFTSTEVERFSYLQDSKKMTVKQREEILKTLLKIGDFKISHVSNKEIDKKGLQQANHKSIFNTLKHLTKNQNHSILIDHINIKDYLLNKGIHTPGCESISKGDSKSFCIAAASVIAKQHRDYLMFEYHDHFPEYGFNSHVGYGTKKHIEAIKTYGPCKIHRTSYKIFSKLA